MAQFKSSCVVGNKVRSEGQRGAVEGSNGNLHRSISGSALYAGYELYDGGRTLG
jgi:hypothetical protein